MIRELTNVIQSHLSGNGTITAIAPVYLSNAPQASNYPYITHFPVSEDVINTHRYSDSPDDVLWQFDVWTTNVISLASIHTELRASLDSATLSLNTLAQVGLIRGSAQALMREADTQAGIIYHQPIEYQIIVV